MSQNKMFHFKHNDGGITFIGWNDKAKVYSTSYYANVGLLNAEESKHTKYSEVKKMTKQCQDLGYKEVTYLPRKDD